MQMQYWAQQTVANEMQKIHVQLTSTKTFNNHYSSLAHFIDLPLLNKRKMQMQMRFLFAALNI